MSSNAGRYTPVAGQPVNVDTGTPWEYIRIINSSPYALSLSLGGQGTIDFPEMYLEDIKIQQSYNGKLNFTPFSNIPNPAAALTNYVSINVYQPGEIRQPQAQPLTTMANVGNSLPLSATATAVANDGNASGTEFVEASIGGVKFVSLLNQGFLELMKNLAASNQTFLQMAPADTPGANWGIGLSGSGNLILQDLAGGFIPLTLSNGAAGGLKLSGRGNFMQGWSIFSGTGSGTFSHGLGTTPNLVLPMQSSVGSQTMGWDSANGTTVHITAGNGAAWVALAAVLA